MQVDGFGVVGKSTLYQRDGTPVPVTITAEPGPSSDTKIFEVIDRSNQLLGRMVTIDRPSAKWVEIDRLHNCTNDFGGRKIKEIGKILVSCAIQLSFFLEHEGCVHTVSSGDSQYFYWSLGMRPDHSRVFASEEAEEIYRKLLNGIPLSDLEELALPLLKHYAKKETGKSELELTPDDICLMDLTKRMQKQYEEAVAKKRHANYGLGSLNMHMPKENLQQFSKIYSPK